jgi:PAS domain S-box-containing protein
VAKVVSGTIGKDFFASMVKHLADALDADGVYIGELIDNPTARVKTLAAYWKNGQSYDSDQELSSTAAGHILRDRDFLCSKNVTRLFPFDRLLEAVHAETYVGIHLADSRAQTIGLLALIKSQPMNDLLSVKSVLEAFAPRASAELERKRADDTVKEDEERYRAFISTNPDGMWRIEFEQPIPVGLPEEEQIERIYQFGYVAECNEAMCRLAGVTLERLVGARVGDVVPRSDERILNELRSAVRSGFSNATVETHPLDESGRPLYRLRSQFCIVEDGELRRIWGTTRDITELRRAELAAAASDRQFRQTMETIRLPAVILNPDGSPAFCNDCFLQMAHRQMEELTRTHWLEGIVPDQERNLWKTALVQQKDKQQATFEHFESTIHSNNDAPPRLIAWDTIPLRNAHGEFAGLAAIGQDITRQRAVELEIRRAQKLEGIGHLASGVAHDLASFLTVILGRTSLLLDETDKADSRYSPLKSIEKAASECAQLTKQLLAIGRKQDLHPSAISLNTLVVDYESTIRDLIGPRVQLVIKLHPESGSFSADRAQIQRVIANLVTNARDAMPDGGQLTISTSPVIVGGFRPMLMNPGIYTRLSVTDTGSGLSDEIQSHIFEPFFTTKPPGKGSGLGLSIVHGIVSQSGGHIRVHSRPGQGTTIEIFFPSVEA